MSCRGLRRPQGVSAVAGVVRLWRATLPAGSVGLAWLGQAGFGMRCGDCRLFIDPYLSDSLAQKYLGAEFPHERMMAPPIKPEEVRGLDWVLCTHRHSDHMDPGTLPVLARTQPDCRFVVPRAERDGALHAGVPVERMVTVNAGEDISLCREVALSAVASAHETIKVNEQGEHHFLGFILKTPRWAIYHSGDCAPYDGLVEELRRHQIDLALLPVNGRDAYRSSRGFAGNLTFGEAKKLCDEAGIRYLVPHHFGMFAFNTLEEDELRREARGAGFRGRCLLPSTEEFFLLEPQLPKKVLRRSTA